VRPTAMQERRKIQKAYVQHAMIEINQNNQSFFGLTHRLLVRYLLLLCAVGDFSLASLKAGF
jgi:hypothetical protein